MKEKVEDMSLDVEVEEEEEEEEEEVEEKLLEVVDVVEVEEMLLDVDVEEKLLQVVVEVEFLKQQKIHNQCYCRHYHSLAPRLFHLIGLQ